MTAEEKLKEYDFSFMSDIELALMQSELKRFPEDHAFRVAVLKELGSRGKIDLIANLVVERIKRDNAWTMR